MTTATTVRERPIIFSGEMVKAILEGRKTQTRRVVKPQPPSDTIRLYPIETADFSATTGEWVREWLNEGRPWTDNTKIRCPFGQPGDRLWCREGWALEHSERRGELQVVYRAGGTARPLLGYPGRWVADGQYACSDTEAKALTQRPGWRSPLHMPRWASRLTLEISEVRVQRLQEISEEDAVAEGCGPAIDLMAALKNSLTGSSERVHTSRGAYGNLWDSLNAKRGYSWASNPWCWAISFRSQERG